MLENVKEMWTEVPRSVCARGACAGARVRARAGAVDAYADTPGQGREEGQASEQGARHPEDVPAGRLGNIGAAEPELI